MAHHQKPKVAICGSGGLGWYIAKAIIDANEWDLVILSRNERPDLAASGIKVKAVDYADPDHIRRVLRRQQVHTVISVIQDEMVQINIIDACVAAGVARFAPAEFEGAPSNRPLFSNSNAGRLTVLRRLQVLQEHGELEHCVFACGLFMEYFKPRGWLGCGGSGYNDGTFLIDLANNTAALPVDGAERLNSVVCLTSANDVGKFVAAALSITWDRAEMKMYGDRLRLRDMLNIAQTVRDRKFEVDYLTEDAVENHLSHAAQSGDWRGHYELSVMQAITNQEYDLGQRDLNSNFPEIRPVSFESFIRHFWRPSRN